MPGYTRYPALSGAHLAFVCEDCLWIAPRAGGVARRLTTDLSEVRAPAFSPDGSQIAFLSNAEGTFEVFVMPAEGGLPRRLTFEGTNTGLIGFTPKSKVLFTSSREGAFGSQTAVYEVGIDGTGLGRVPVGYALHVSFHRDGDTVAIGRNTRDSAHWKRYRGGTAGEIWVGSLATQTFTRLAVGGNPVLPTFIGDRVYFISDEDGFGNVWSIAREGGEATPHTSHRDFYARQLSAHGTDAVYQRGGEIWRLDTTTGTSAVVDIDTRPSGAQLRRKFIEPEDQLQDVVASANGKSLACVVRGKLLAMAAWGGAVRWLGQRSGVRYRHPVWIHDDAEIVVLSDEGGEEAPEVYDVSSGTRRTRVRIDEARRIKRLVPNPARRQVAAADSTGQLFLIDLEGDGAAKLVEKSTSGPILEPAWSPDGRWLAYVVPAGVVSGGVIRLFDTTSGETVSLTSEELPGHSPTFDPSGRFLYMIAERTFKPVFSPTCFDASVPVASRLYAFVLKKDQMSPFDPRFADVLEAEEKEKEKKEKGEEKSEDKEKVHAVEIDLEGLADRIVTVPDVPVGSYTNAQAGEHKLLYLSSEPEADTSPGEEHTPTLECFDIKTSKITTVLTDVKRYDVRGEKTLVWSEKTVYLIETGEEPPKDPPKEGHNRHTGMVDLGRLRIEVVPAEEWRQMLLEAWRLQRDHFWAESMAGIDWDEIRDRYLGLLERVSTRSELSDVIWELQGELGTSHAYEFGGDYPDRASYPVGNLGADLRWDGKGYVVDRIPAGDPWARKVASPLTAPGVNISPGDRITAVGGRAVTEARPPVALLVHEAESDVELTVEPGGDGEPRRVTVRTLGSERLLRYRDWVNRKRAHVAERSRGALGYLHIPDMGGRGLAEFYRSYRAQSKRPGLIVDVRNNGGGFVSQLIIEHLRRQVIGYDRPRHGRTETYPFDAVRGPIVAICDQFAGSDGDIFSHAFKRYEIGTLVGTRTWGGVVGIDMDVDKMLADGTIVTQPEYSTYFEGVGWNVENFGVEPDEEVVLDPAAMARGEDLQLDRAVDIALEQLEKIPVREPEWPDVPSRRF